MDFWNGAPDEWTRFSNHLTGVSVIVAFEKESTRTFISSWIAAILLGARVGAMQGMEFSSIAKGESWQDTVMALDENCDCLILRTESEWKIDVARQTCEHASVINAGAGTGEHPTQTLLDAFTICEEFPGRDNLKLTVVGDILNGRTIHSLVRHFAGMNGSDSRMVQTIHFVGDRKLQASPELIRFIEGRGIKVEVSHELTMAIMAESDIFYTSRPQFMLPGEQDLHIDHTRFSCTPEFADAMPGDGIIMHPLPRDPKTRELPIEMDRHPKLRIRQQMRYGKYCRMPLIAHCVGMPIPKEE